MERIPIEERTDLHEVVTGGYNLVFEDEIRPDNIDLYAIESEHVEAEIELPYIGINREEWEDEWSVERKLEVLLHEFAHIDETEDEPDHGPRFYNRLADLTEIAEAHQSELETLFGTSIDFRTVHQHIVDSVNEYTVETDIEGVEDRQSDLRETFALSGESACD